MLYDEKYITIQKMQLSQIDNLIYTKLLEFNVFGYKSNSFHTFPTFKQCTIQTLLKLLNMVFILILVFEVFFINDIVLFRNQIYLKVE